MGATMQQLIDMLWTAAGPVFGSWLPWAVWLMGAATVVFVAEMAGFFIDGGEARVASSQSAGGVPQWTLWAGGMGAKAARGRAKQPKPYMLGLNAAWNRKGFERYAASVPDASMADSDVRRAVDNLPLPFEYGKSAVYGNPERPSGTRESEYI